MLRSVLLGGEPIDISQLEAEEDARDQRMTNSITALAFSYEAIRASNVRAAARS